MRKRIIRGFLSVFSAEVGTQMLALFITPLLVRLLTKSEYGNYVFIISVYSITMVFVEAGFLKGIRKYIAEDRESTGWEGQVFGFYFRFAVLIAVIGGLLVVVVGTILPVEEYFGDGFRTYIYLFAALIASTQLFLTARSGLMGIGKEHLSEPLRIVKKILFGTVGLSLAALGYGVGGVLFGNLAAQTVVAILALLLLSREISLMNVLERAPSDFPRRELFSFNVYTLVLTLLFTTLYQVDIVLMRLLVGSRPVASYKIALTIAEFIWLIPVAMKTVLLQSTSTLWSRGEHDRITVLSSLAVRYTLLLSALLAIGLAVVGDEFIPLYYGSKYSTATLPLLLLLPGTLGFAASRPLVSIGEGKGEIKTLIVATGLAAALNLVLNLLLIPTYGAVGAAVATSIGYGSMFIFHFWTARKIGFDPMYDLRLPRIVATVLVTAPVIVVVGELVKSDLLSLFVVPPVGFVVYSLAAVGTGAVGIEELQDLLQDSPVPVDQFTSKLEL